MAMVTLDASPHGTGNVFGNKRQFLFAVVIIIVGSKLLPMCLLQTFTT